MAQGLVLTFLGNRIEWATHNDHGIVTGKRKDVTNDAVKAVIQHMHRAYDSHERAKERGYFAYAIDGVGEVRFIPHELRQPVVRRYICTNCDDPFYVQPDNEVNCCPYCGSDHVKEAHEL